MAQVTDAARDMAQTPASVTKGTEWAELGFEIRLPPSSARPPLLRLELFDTSPDPSTNAVNKRAASRPLASADVRLTDGAKGSELSESIPLHYNVLRYGVNAVRKVTVRFKHQTMDNQPAQG